jgi:hypothetical protein
MRVKIIVVDRSVILEEVIPVDVINVAIVIVVPASFASLFFEVGPDGSFQVRVLNLPAAEQQQSANPCDAESSRSSSAAGSTAGSSSSGVYTYVPSN